ncbi:4a-hydroxytetrahydrobiopterin dehydratase [Sanguibacter sp. A247]|uniref:4a-hydroxytetrahydrobiopterin dehydratase n=1 Tax=unclassified Sanguibacter TaxID=2645534 RepID=UPI003FD814AA
MEPVEEARAEAAVAGTGWQVEEGALVVRYATGTFVAGVRLIERIASAAEAADHHPDVTLTYPWVELTLTTHDVGALTSADVDLAVEIAELARDHGIDVAERN